MNRGPIPWWLEQGAERCPFCEGHLHFEALAYCTDCDRPVCQSCLVAHQESGRVQCPACHAETGAVR
jgi:hypothetical protein